MIDCPRRPCCLEAHRRLRPVPGWAIAFAFLVVSGCPAERVSERPWVVVLQPQVEPGEAEQAVNELRARHPELKDCRSIRLQSDNGSTQTVVVSGGFADLSAAEVFRQGLNAREPARLAILDLRQARVLPPIDGVPRPQALVPFLDLARWLPRGAGARAQSVRVRTVAGAEPEGDSGQAWIPRGFLVALEGLPMWTASASAVYGAQTGEGRVFVFQGHTQDAEALRKLFAHLQGYARKAEDDLLGSLGAPPPPRKSRQGKANRRWQDLPSMDQGTPSPEPPPPQDFQMPWGRQATHVVDRLVLVPAHQAGPKTKRYTALLSWGPDRRFVQLVVHSDARVTEELLAKETLGRPTGLALMPFWETLGTLLPPEPSRGGDRLVECRLQGWSEWLPGVPAGSRDWIVVGMGFLDVEGKPWFLSVADVGDETQAAAWYERALVQPRQAQIQGLLTGKVKPRYDLGVSLRDIGDGQAWTFRGAWKGRGQELYFHHAGRLFLLQALWTGPKALAENELIQRAERLPIWGKAQ